MMNWPSCAMFQTLSDDRQPQRSAAAAWLISSPARARFVMGSQNTRELSSSGPALHGYIDARAQARDGASLRGGEVLLHASSHSPPATRAKCFAPSGGECLAIIT